MHFSCTATGQLGYIVWNGRRTNTDEGIETWLGVVLDKLKMLMAFLTAAMKECFTHNITKSWVRCPTDLVVPLHQ